MYYGAYLSRKQERIEKNHYMVHVRKEEKKSRRWDHVCTRHHQQDQVIVLHGSQDKIKELRFSHRQFTLVYGGVRRHAYICYCAMTLSPTCHPTQGSSDQNKASATSPVHSPRSGAHLTRIRYINTLGSSPVVDPSLHRLLLPYMDQAIRAHQQRASDTKISGAILSISYYSKI
jgi:hypothetical protein